MVDDNHRRRNDQTVRNRGGGGVYAVFLIVAVMFVLSESGQRYEL